ncbi:hypothetical protein AGMMS49950_10800 [Endomicrobiia bacterium]|nr:hypothetical protein AGMMS49950_10800 [Endomicrobiia bacterium]
MAKSVHDETERNELCTQIMTKSIHDETEGRKVKLNERNERWEKYHESEEGKATSDDIAKENFVRLEIEGEKYGTSILRIKHELDRKHFWYKSPEDSFLARDCTLDTARRLLHHAGQIGIVHKDLWNKYSNKELREILADQLIIKNNPMRANVVKLPLQYLYAFEMAILLRTLGIPNKHIDFLLDLSNTEKPCSKYNSQTGTTWFEDECARIAAYSRDTQ